MRPAPKALRAAPLTALLGCADYTAAPAIDRAAATAAPSADVVDPRVVRYVVADHQDPSVLAPTVAPAHAVCLATRVAPRFFLTAAHCLVQKLQPNPMRQLRNVVAFRAGMKPGDPFRASPLDGTDEAWSRWRLGAIARVYVHPSLLNCMRDVPIDGDGRVGDTCGRAVGSVNVGDGAGERLRPLQDLAIVEVTEDAPNAPSAPLGQAPAAGARVTVVGWGCVTASAPATEQVSLGRKGRVEVPVVTRGGDDPWAASRFVTRGGLRSDGATSVLAPGAPLCPGDDAAPAFVDGALAGLRTRPFVTPITAPLPAEDVFQGVDGSDGEFPALPWIAAVLGREIEGSELPVAPDEPAP